MRTTTRARLQGSKLCLVGDVPMRERDREAEADDEESGIGLVTLGIIEVKGEAGVNDPAPFLKMRSYWTRCGRRGGRRR